MLRGRTVLLAGLLGSSCLLAGCAGAGSGPPHAEVDGHAAWSYEGDGTGPPDWGRLRHEFALCDAGREQSPVDLAPATAESRDLADIAFDYRPSRLALVNNGHTVQADYEPGSSIRIDGEQYRLVQLHFHAPSEHTVEGRSYAMEVHLVHADAQGRLAVVGVLVTPGAESPAFAPIAASLPTEGESVSLPKEISALGLLPADRRVLRYAGSLTTPPCTEGVVWSVFVEPIAMSPAQIAAFVELIGPNRRPVQPLHGRVVTLDTR